MQFCVMWQEFHSFCGEKRHAKTVTGEQQTKSLSNHPLSRVTVIKTTALMGESSATKTKGVSNYDNNMNTLGYVARAYLRRFCSAMNTCCLHLCVSHRRATTACFINHHTSH
jgi:hypothetical protein